MHRPAIHRGTRAVHGPAERGSVSLVGLGGSGHISQLTHSRTIVRHSIGVYPTSTQYVSSHSACVHGRPSTDSEREVSSRHITLLSAEGGSTAAPCIAYPPIMMHISTSPRRKGWRLAVANTSPTRPVPDWGMGYEASRRESSSSISHVSRQAKQV